VGAVGKVIVLVVIAAVAIVLAITVLGYVGPFVAVLGVLLAAVVVINPGGVGGSLRLSMAWWSIPGMRRASARAAPFATLLLLYTVPVPVGAFALLHGVSHGSPSSPSGPALAVGGGATSAGVTPVAVTPASTLPPTVSTIAPAVVRTAAPTRPPTAPPTARPTAIPAPPPNLCGAPPNPWNYNFCGRGGTISAPPGNLCLYFKPCTGTFWTSTKGYVEQCVDGYYSHSGGRPGSCSTHGGNRRPLNP
jgi:hypothetical protein